MPSDAPVVPATTGAYRSWPSPHQLAANRHAGKQDLPLQLISKSLFEQFAPNMEPLADYVQIDYATYAEYAKKLDNALQARNAIAVRETFEAFATLNWREPD